MQPNEDIRVVVDPHQTKLIHLDDKSHSQQREDVLCNVCPLITAIITQLDKGIRPALYIGAARDKPIYRHYESHSHVEWRAFKSWIARERSLPHFTFKPFGIRPWGNGDTIVHGYTWALLMADRNLIASSIW